MELPLVFNLRQECQRDFFGYKDVSRQIEAFFGALKSIPPAATTKWMS